MAEISGVLVINKHGGVTSHDIVNKIRRLFGTKRVGHTGTLDPMATGVLVILVGRAAKAAEYLVCDEKSYLATLKLGITTDTEDTTGRIITTSDELPSAQKVTEACRVFVGKIKQIPPMYSALKVGGKKLCDIARAGGEIEREAREIEIFSLECAPTDSATDYLLDVRCSSGTYIRTLCADIGKKLGCGGVMAALERTEAGGFDISGAHTVEQLEKMSADEREALLIPTERLFESLPKVTLTEFYEKLCRNGCEIYLKKIRKELDVSQRVSLYGSDGTFFAIGEVREYESGRAIKTVKMFDV